MGLFLGIFAPVYVHPMKKWTFEKATGKNSVYPDK